MGGPAQPMANPIITVTEHTPTPSPDYLKRQVVKLSMFLNVVLHNTFIIILKLFLC